MLIGQYWHSIDEKSRLIVPQKLRESLGEEFIVTVGIDGCLFVMPQDEWTKFKERMSAQPMVKVRDLQRYFFGNAALVSPDKQGRIILPPHLRKAANLTKDVTIIGADNRVEIWDSERWNEWNLKQNDFMGTSAAATMEEIGI